MSEERKTIYRGRNNKDVHRTKCETLTIVRLTPSLYTTKIARKKVLYTFYSLI